MQLEKAILDCSSPRGTPAPLRQNRRCTPGWLCVGPQGLLLVVSGARREKKERGRKRERRGGREG